MTTSTTGLVVTDMTGSRDAGMPPTLVTGKGQHLALMEDFRCMVREIG